MPAKGGTFSPRGPLSHLTLSEKGGGGGAFIVPNTNRMGGSSIAGTESNLKKILGISKMPNRSKKKYTTGNTYQENFKSAFKLW